MAGSTKRNTHLMTASLAVSLVGMLLAFEFVAEVRQVVHIADVTDFK